MKNQIIIEWEDDGEIHIDYSGNAGETELYYLSKEIHGMLRKGILNKITVNKKCDSCGEYFISKKATEIYCDNCRHIGYLNKIKTDELLKAYNTAYKTKHAQKQRKTRGKGIDSVIKYENAITKWRIDAKNKLELAQHGEISELEFKLYLDKPLEV